MKLQGKIFLLFLSIAVLMGGPLIWTVQQSARRIDLNEVIQRGTLKTVDLAERIPAEFQVARESSLLPLLQAAQEQTEAVYAVAIDLDGRVLAHTNVAEKGQIYQDVETLSDLRSKIPLAHRAIYKGVPVMDVAAPVWFHAAAASTEDFLLSGEKTGQEKTRLGIVRLGLPLAPVLEREYLLFRRITLILLIAGGGGILLVFFFMRRLLRPVHSLSLATARVAKGEYGVSVPVYTKDELGDLGKAFNEMSEVLAKTTVSKQALQASQEELMEAQRLAHIGNWRLISQSGEFIWSDEVYRIFGRDSHLAAPTFEEHVTILTSDGLLQMKSAIDRALQVGTPYEIDLEIKRPDHTSRWIIARGECLRDATGRVVGVHGTAQDITDRKQGDEQRTLLFAAIEQSKDSIVITDAKGTILYVNRAFETVSGYTRHEVIGKNPRLLKSSKHDKAFYEDMWTTLTSGHVWENVITNKRKDGNLFEEEVCVCPVMNDVGTITHYVAVKRDIAERRKLETIVRQSDKMSAVGQLAAGVAHEINNPLGVILGFAQALVRRLQANDPFEMPLKSIEKEAIRCKDLVQDLLTFSRASKVDREPIDINRAVEGALSLVMAQARVARIEVKKELAPALPRVLGNQNQVQQIIINLSNNAMDAMGNTGILTLKTEQYQEDALSWVCLKVIDTGPGIPAEIRSRIFDPFFTTKPVGKGTGLGLSLVHEIVQKHSGSITLESRPGHTEFIIKFPVRSSGLPSVPTKAAS